MTPRQAGHELLASVGVLTALPVARLATRRGSVLALAPVVGLGLGGAAAGVLTGARWLFAGPGGTLLAAALAVAGLALATRGLHLDGLADTVDGLGCAGDAQRALAVMRRSDIGPFGVAALVATLLVDIAALARDETLHRGPAALLVAVVCGRVAMLQAGGPASPPARRDGLGAGVAASVPSWWVRGATALSLAGPAGFALAGHPGPGLRLAGALLAGWLAAAALRRLALRRFGGVTGDVFGALCEVATAVALLVSALR